MMIWLVGLRYVIGGDLNDAPLFCWPRLRRYTSLLKTEQEPRAVLAASSWGHTLVLFDGKPADRRFC